MGEDFACTAFYILPQGDGINLGSTHIGVGVSARSHNTRSPVSSMAY